MQISFTFMQSDVDAFEVDFSGVEKEVEQKIPKLFIHTYSFTYAQKVPEKYDKHFR